MNINIFLNHLADNSSRNYKIEQLTAHKDNEVLREVIRLALDPFTQFYQRKIPVYTANGGGCLTQALGYLQELSSRKVTGNAAIKRLTEILSGLDSCNAKIIERIISKDLKCGVDVSTANKVWSGLIAEYPCMLCSPFDEKIAAKFKFPALAQLKMDGMRFNAIVKDGKCEFRSRNGKEINLLGNLEQEFITLAGGSNLVYDGELLVVVEGNIQDRQTGNGILNKAVKGTISPDEAKKVEATVWDCIPYDQFKAGVGVAHYCIRFATLESSTLPHKIRLVESTVVNSLDEAQTIFEGYLSQGQEGIILKDMSGVWQDKRVKTQVKFKGELECDLKIVAIEPGTGKYVGMLGAIVCESADGKIKVNVGSGFNDAQRKNLGSEILDKIVAIKYNMRIKNKLGDESLFLPVFIEIRDDKDIADSSKDIK